MSSLNTNTPASRISKLKEIADPKRGWGGLLASKQGDKLIWIYGVREVPIGDWLFFLYHVKTLPDNRVIFSDTACFWLNVPKSFKLEGIQSMYYPIPQEIENFIIQDGTYSEWENAFQAIDNYFCNDKSWQYQWSWKTEGVKNFMAGKCSDWISSVSSQVENKEIVKEDLAIKTAIEKEDWSALKSYGVEAEGFLLDALRESTHPAEPVLLALTKLGTPLAQAAIVSLMKDQSRYSKIAKNLLNSGRSKDEEYILCPRCNAFLGVRKDLLTQTNLITPQMRDQAAKMRVEIIAHSSYPCPKCKSQVLL